MLPATRKGNYIPSIFDDFLNTDIARDFFSSERSTPAVNVSEDKNKFTIEVAAPGLDKKDFKVNVENNVLTISSEKEDKDEKKDENDNFLRREFSYSSFQRSFSLPEGVKPDDINAKHENGVLYVTIPKKDELKQQPSKQIEIK